MKKLFLAVLFLIFAVCTCMAGCTTGPSTPNGPDATTDKFAIANITKLTREGSVKITFTDLSESKVTYTYDTENLLIEDNKVSAFPTTPAGDYVVTATNADTTVTFTVTVVGDSLVLILKNNAENAPIGFGNYVSKGTTVQLLEGETAIKTASVGTSGKISFDVPNGDYVVSVEGYKDFSVTVNGVYNDTVICDYLLFTDKEISANYLENGYIELSSDLEFIADDVVYAEMTIYAPTDIATTQNGNDVGGTFFKLNTSDFVDGSATKNNITFGGHWNKTYYRLRWGNERWSAVKEFDAEMLGNLTNQDKGVKIAIAVLDGIAYAYMENGDGELELIAMNGGQINVLDIVGIARNLNAKVSGVRYATDLSKVPMGVADLKTSLSKRNYFVLDTTGLTVSGSQVKGYTVTGPNSGAIGVTKAVQNGYYDLNSDSVIAFDYNYKVSSTSKYYTSMRFNDSIEIQLCVWNGLLTVKYDSATVVTNDNFNDGNNTGEFTARIAIHADSDGYLAIYKISSASEQLLFTSATKDRPFDFDKIRKIDIAFNADSANDWSITNLKVCNDMPTATVSFAENQYVIYDKTFTNISYGETKDFAFIPLSGYEVSAVKIDGEEVPFTIVSDVVKVNFTKCDMATAHSVTIEGEMTIPTTFFKSSELSKYQIVYDGDFTELASLAQSLKNAISSKYGVTLSVVKDNTSTPSDYEILLGDTNRYNLGGKIMQYSVTVIGEKFKINVGGLFSAEKAIEYLVNNVFTGKSIELSTGEYYTKNFITTKQAVTAGTTVRIMSANMLADSFDNGSYREAVYRAEIFAGSLVAYTPDVLGVQETDTNWNNVLDKYLDKIYAEYGIRYTRYFATYENKVNYTSLIYRSDKFTVGDSGVKVFSWWKDANFNHSYHMRNVSWAQFTSISNSMTRFVVANTHWSYRTEHDGGNKYLSGSSTPIATNQLRTQCKDETNALLTTLKNNYSGSPVFLTGDFNTSLPFFTDWGWLNSSYKVVSAQATSAGTCITTVPTSSHFDHIMGTGSYTVKRFDFFANTNYKNLVSDHPFVYADLAF